MAKSKIDNKFSIQFDTFRSEIENKEDGLEVISASDMVDPNPNKSGSFNLDYDLVIPFPAGRIIEIFGAESTCKTTLTLEVAGQAIESGKVVLYINMEKNLNLSLMRTVRTLRPYIDDAIKRMENNDESNCPLWIAKAITGEQALETMKKFASMVPNSIAILDSIDAAQPSAVLSGEIGENKVGNLAKLMSDAMRKLVSVADTNNVSLIFVNQLRDKITMYGKPDDTPGGRAVRFYATQRIELKKPRKDDFIDNADGERIGVVIRYTIVKNKVAPDGVEGSFPILLKNGIFREQELITKCCNFGILKMGGKGGKQVYLPKNFNNLEDGIWYSQFNAARRLLLDKNLTKQLNNALDNILGTERYDPVDKITDEIQDPQE